MSRLPCHCCPWPSYRRNACRHSSAGRGSRLRGALSVLWTLCSSHPDSATFHVEDHVHIQHEGSAQSHLRAILEGVAKLVLSDMPGEIVLGKPTHLRLSEPQSHVGKPHEGQTLRFRYCPAVALQHPTGVLIAEGLYLILDRSVER